MAWKNWQYQRHSLGVPSPTSCPSIHNDGRGSTHSIRVHNGHDNHEGVHSHGSNCTRGQHQPQGLLQHQRLFSFFPSSHNGGRGSSRGSSHSDQGGKEQSHGHGHDSSCTTGQHQLRGLAQHQLPFSFSPVAIMVVRVVAAVVAI